MYFCSFQFQRWESLQNKKVTSVSWLPTGVTSEQWEKNFFSSSSRLFLSFSSISHPKLDRHDISKPQELSFLSFIISSMEIQIGVLNDGPIRTNFFFFSIPSLKGKTVGHGIQTFRHVRGTKSIGLDSTLNSSV